MRLLCLWRVLFIPLSASCNPVLFSPVNGSGDEAPLPADGMKPNFTEKPVIRQSADGSKIIFECKLIADPVPSIEWFHQDKVVREGSRHKYTLFSDKHTHLASLEISKPSISDAGDYRVVAKNSKGEGVASISLNFDQGKAKVPSGKPPRFPKKPTIKQVATDLILECILEANPFPTITWFHGTKVVKEDSRHKISCKEIAKETYQLTLEIKDPETPDGGNYRCNAINELGESNANIALNFQEEEETEEEEEEEEDLSPSFISPPKIIPKNGGALIIMECRVQSSSKITTSWFKGSSKVTETTKIKSSIIEDKKEEYTVRLELNVSYLLCL